MDWIVVLVLFVTRSFAGNTTPSDVYISFFSTPITSQEKKAVLSAIDQVNLDSTLLPNTQLHMAEATLSEENPIRSALNISKNNTTSLILGAKPQESHDALSSMLHTPLLSTRPSRAVALNQPFSTYGVSIGLDSYEVMLDLIVKYLWTNVIVLYDVRWRDSASIFMSRLPSSIYFLPLDIILDQTGLINKTTENKLILLKEDGAQAIVLFCDASVAEEIIRQVHPLLSHKTKRTHRWLLADPLASLKLEAEEAQIIIGFAHRVFNNPKTTALTAALSTNITSTRLSSFLVFDAIFAYAHALHDMIVANKWEPLTTGSNIIEFKNGKQLLKYIKKVNASGTTGVIQFDDGGHRRHAVIDVMNLRDNTFMKIGEWSETPKLTMTSPPVQNHPIITVVPLNQLKRKLKIALIEDPPFVMYKVDEQTNTETLEGFSVDLIKGIAEILQFQYEFYLSPDGKYSGTNPDGSLSGVIGEVYKGNADMSSMPLTINSERLQYIGFSKPFMYISMDLVIKKANAQEYDITGFMTPYTIMVWVMTLVTWIVVSIILTLVNYFSPYGHRLCDEEQNGDEFSWFNSLWFCLASMLQQGGDSTPRMLSGRIVVGSFWFCILVWVSTYTANLAAFLTQSKNQVTINTLEDVLAGEYHMYILRDTALYDFFKTSDYRVYRLLWERMATEKTFVDSSSDGFHFVRTREKTVYMEESPFADYLVNQEPCDVVSAKDVTGSSSYGIAMAKDFPYITNISIAILKMQELGRLGDLKRKWWDERYICPRVKQLSSKEIVESKRIQIYSMIGVYLLLGAGGVASIVVIFIEIWWKKRRDRINARVRQGWAVVKSTQAVIGLKKQKPDAMAVVQAFKGKGKEKPKVEEKDLGVGNNACNVPSKTPAFPWGEAVQNKQLQQRQEILAITNKAFFDPPTKTPDNDYEAIQVKPPKENPKIEAKDHVDANTGRDIPAKTPANGSEADQVKPPKDRPKRDVKNRGEAKRIRYDSDKESGAAKPNEKTKRVAKSLGMANWGFDIPTKPLDF